MTPQISTIEKDEIGNSGDKDVIMNLVLYKPEIVFRLVTLA